jgi:hypothetical protein
VTLDATLAVLVAAGVAVQLVGYASLEHAPGGLPKGRLSMAEKRFLFICVVPFLVRMAQLLPESLPKALPEMTAPLAGWSALLLAAALVVAPLVGQLHRRGVSRRTIGDVPFVYGGLLFVVGLAGVATSPFHESDLRRELQAHERACRNAAGDLLTDRLVGDKVKGELDGELKAAAADARKTFEARGFVAARSRLEPRVASFQAALERLKRERDMKQEQERAKERMAEERDRMQREREARLSSLSYSSSGY